MDERLDQRIAIVDAMSEIEDLNLNVRLMLRRLLHDAEGFVIRRVLPDGQALGVTVQFSNAKLTLSESIDSLGWSEAW